MADINLNYKGLKAKANLDFNPFIDGLKRKIKNEREDIYSFLERNQDYGKLGAGILNLLSGKNIDLPPLKHGKHSFGIRDINLDIARDYPELFYEYENKEDPLNFRAMLGGDIGDQYMKIGGKFTFAGGGLASLLGY